MACFEAIRSSTLHVGFSIRIRRKQQAMTQNTRVWVMMVSMVFKLIQFRL